MADMFPRTDKEDIREALSYIDPTSYQAWMETGLSIKSEFGDSGFALWDDWSQRADNYNPRTSRKQWKCFKDGSRKIASVIWQAKSAGWVQKKGRDRDFYRKEHAQPKKSPEDARLTSLLDDIGHEIAAKNAESVVKRSKFGENPYLKRKKELLELGIPNSQWEAGTRFPSRGLVLGENLIIPMRRPYLGGQLPRVMAIQTIDPNGKKKFTPGSRVKGLTHRIGGKNWKNYNPKIIWWTEGYVNALVVSLAVKGLYRDDPVFAAFSGSNLTHVARRGIVVADHDEHGYGEACAKRTGLPYLLPEQGDAFDYAVAKGIHGLSEAMRPFIRDK